MLTCLQCQHFKEKSNWCSEYHCEQNADEIACADFLNKNKIWTSFVKIVNGISYVSHHKGKIIIAYNPARHKLTKNDHQEMDEAIKAERKTTYRNPIVVALSDGKTLEEIDEDIEKLKLRP
jgi:hypothetical protein